MYICPYIFDIDSIFLWILQKLLLNNPLPKLSPLYSYVCICRFIWVFPFRLLPFRLLPFCLLPLRLLPFRLLSNFTSFPFRLHFCFVPYPACFSWSYGKHTMYDYFLRCENMLLACDGIMVVQAINYLKWGILW